MRVVVGSGSIEAMSVLENRYHPDIEVLRTLNTLNDVVLSYITDGLDIFSSDRR